jgi:hypothetical protein
MYFLSVHETFFVAILLQWSKPQTDSSVTSQEDRYHMRGLKKESQEVGALTASVSFVLLPVWVCMCVCG